MTDIAIEFNNQQVQRVLDDLVTRVEDPADIMRQVADVLEDATARAFDGEEDPATGVMWDPLSQTTLDLNPARKDGSILQASGQLAAGIVSDYGRDFAEVGSNKVYAPTHQFGAEKGEFGTSSRGRPIPWGDIPARPFLGISPTDEEDILDIAQQHLAGGFG